MADVLPEYLTDQTEDAIRQRILDRFAPTLDKNQGSALYDMASAMALEMALGANWAQEVLRRGFAQTTFGVYLRMRAAEHGVIWKEAQAATGTVTFTGASGATVPAGTRVSTGSTQTQAAIVFATDKAVTIPVDGASADVTITAEAAGTSGNVASGAISFLVAPIDGITSAANADATSGGTDDETDEALLSRYLTKVRNPSAGGNKADYVNWALEVPGVGGVSVVPVRDGAGTVSIALINADKSPADQTLVDAVQQYIAPQAIEASEAEDGTLGDVGTSVVVDQDDATSGKCVKMEYDADGAANIFQTMTDILPQPGLWTVRARVKVDDDSGANDLLQICVYNLSQDDWAQTAPSGGTDASASFKANELAESFTNVSQQFYWNGTDNIQLRIYRLQDDTSTVLWADRFEYRSLFSKEDGDGKAPIGAKVAVEAAESLLINVSATLTIANGYDAASVQAAAEQAIDHYLKSLSFADNNDVLYVKIGDAIIGTTGISDYASLTVNSGTSNIAIDVQQVAVKGTVNFS